ncbi:HpcH/HpaI aldolase/citrate lyase family protein, partial [Stomatohabitans albus]
MIAISRPRRTCLSMPASNPKMLAKGATLAVDECFMDLEDSVAPHAKELARQNVIAALHEVDYGDRTVVVRVNAVDSPWHVRDVEAVVTQGGDVPVAVMVPKVETAEDVVFVDRLLSAFEREVG